MRNLLREYIRSVLLESSPDESGLGALVKKQGEEIEVVLFKYDSLYSAMSRRKPEDDVFNFLKDNIFDSIVGYGVFTRPEKGEAYGAYEVTHAAAPGLGKILYGMGYGLSPTGLLMPDRDKNQVSPDADQAWKRASSSRKSLKLDALPPNNKTKNTEDDSVLHDVPGKEHLDYAYEEQGWEKSMTSKLISKGETALKELSDDVNRDINALRHVFMSGGRNFFANQYRSMLQRTRG
jgi:hypothetical protein